MPKSKSRARSKKQSMDAQELMVNELKEIHSAENQLTKNLPRLMKVVETDSFREMLETRLDQGERLIEQIDDIFDEMEMSPGRKKNVAAEGLISDLREHMQEIEEGPALDAAMIAAIQKTEHYCIAAWGTAKALGQALGEEQVVRAMQQALEEGKEMDRQLTRLAEEEVTPQLVSGEEDEEEDEEGMEMSSSRSSRGRTPNSHGERRHASRH